MDTPGFLYQAPNSVLLGPRDPNGKLRSQRKDSEAGLLPLAQPQRKRGNCGGPWEGLGGEARRKGEGSARWNPANPSPFRSGGRASARCPQSPDPASCLPHLITEMRSPEGSLLLLTVLLYFPPAASAAILVAGGGGEPVGKQGQSERKLCNWPRWAVTNGRREVQRRETGQSNRWSKEAGLRPQVSRSRTRSKHSGNCSFLPGSTGKLNQWQLG